MEILNIEEKDYFDGELYQVSIWAGYGYTLNVYRVYADSEQTALELAIKYAEQNEDDILIDIDEVRQDVDKEWDDKLDEQYDGDKDEFIYRAIGLTYVDATMNGASKPYYIYTENLKIERVEE